MRSKPTLSIAPYYGGKGRMAHFIAERLDYDDSDIFVTPFGGMCRVLLNKPRHRVECYNDYSSGLCALMGVLADPDKSDELIHRLYEETEFSKAEFEKQKAIFDNAEIDIEQQEKEKLRRLLIDNKVVSAVSANSLLEELKWQTLEINKEIDNPKRNKLIPSHVAGTTKTVQANMKKLIEKLNSDDDFYAAVDKHLRNWVKLAQVKDQQGILPRPADMGEYVSDMDLAIATYVVFKQSRDGMGQAWSEVKFRDTDHYLKSVLDLYECAERLEGISVYQIDAVDFFRRRVFVDVNTPIDTVPPQFRLMNKWINNSKVMMYCDPSYISVESEAKLLDGIDVAHTENLSSAIREKYNGKKWPKNLGKNYACSFGYEEQENFLRCIQKARCKIMVSNYDLELYNKYLNKSTGWRREEFITTTSVGGKVDNSRTEVIWYNY